MNFYDKFLINEEIDEPIILYIIYYTRADNVE
jgi:hypothetical protein